MFAQIINTLSDLLYTYILIILLLGTGIYFSVRTHFVQFRMLREAIRVVMEPKEDENGLIIPGADGLNRLPCGGLEISPASPPPSVWAAPAPYSGCGSPHSSAARRRSSRARWLRSTSDGQRTAPATAPAYYIQAVLKKRWLGVIFAVLLILTYMVGFNLVASFNIADTFRAYSFYDASTTPVIVGAILAVIFCICICGGSRQISKITGILVPAMGIFYLALALFVVVTHFELIPRMFADIFSNAFDFRAIFGGFTGSCIMQGIKRGLFSNEAGVGSAPNAAASASVSHPVKQGLVQMLSVFIDTIVICSATSFLLLCSGIAPSDELKGMPWVQAAAEASLGGIGITFITIALFLFAFTTLIGNFFYAEMGLGYLCDKKPNKWMLIGLRAIATVVVFGGSLMEFSVAWSTADVIMGFLALINLPVIIILISGHPLHERLYAAEKEGRNPVFRAKDIGLGTKTDFWN